jgi:hypothetical protein
VPIQLVLNVMLATTANSDHGFQTQRPPQTLLVPSSLTSVVSAEPDITVQKELQLKLNAPQAISVKLLGCLLHLSLVVLVTSAGEVQVTMEKTVQPVSTVSKALLSQSHAQPVLTVTRSAEPVLMIVNHAQMDSTAQISLRQL